MSVKRSAIFLAGVLMLASSSQAAELEHCGRYDEYQKKTDCLVKNEVTINSSLEVVAGETRKAIQDLRGEVSILKVDIAMLRAEVAALRAIVVSSPLGLYQ